MTKIETERFVSDLKNLTQDAENMLMATANTAGEKLKSTFDSTKESYKKMENRVMTSAKATDQIIRAHPYKSLGVVLGVGTVLGAIALKYKQNS